MNEPTLANIAGRIGALVDEGRVVTFDVFPWAAEREELAARVEVHCAAAVDLLRASTYDAATFTRWLSDAADLLAVVVRDLPPAARRGLSGKLARVVMAVDDHAVDLAYAERRRRG